LAVSHAFHSSLIEPMLDEFERVAATIQYRDPTITLVSNLTGKPVRKGEVTRADYWKRHAREAVRFADGLESAYALNYRVFIEIGPQPILSAMAANCLTSQNCVFLPSMRGEENLWQVLLSTVGDLYLRGVPIDWAAFDRPFPRRKLELPLYPFQRQRYWVETEVPNQSRSDFQQPRSRPDETHPLLERRLHTPLQDVLFETRLDPRRHSYLSQHVVHQEVVVPTTVYLEVVSAAVREWAGSDSTCLEVVLIHEAVRLPPAGRTIQIVLSPNGAAAGQFRLFSLEDDDQWKLAVSGRFSTTAETRNGSADEELTGMTGGDHVDTGAFYAACARLGLQFGPAFQGLDQIRCRDQEAIGQVALPASAGSASGYRLHPASFDACLQVLAAALLGPHPEDETVEVFMPIAIDRFELWGRTYNRLVSQARLEPVKSGAEESRTGHVSIRSEEGALIGRITGLRMKRAPRAALLKTATDDIASLFYQTEWREVDSSQDLAAAPVGDWLIFADSAGTAESLATELRNGGSNCVLVEAGSDYRALGGDVYEVDPAQPEQFDRLIQQFKGGRKARWQGVLYLWPTDVNLVAAASVQDLIITSDLCCRGLLSLVQAVLRNVGDEAPRLWIATRGANAVRPADAQVAVAQSTVWGMAKVISLEHPELQCVRVDLDPAGNDESLLAGELRAAVVEPLVAYRRGRRYISRLARATIDTSAETACLQTGSSPSVQPVQIEIISRGTPDGVALRAATRTPPPAGHVEILVKATGLNFRDVLNVLGLREDDAPLGGEFAGTIVTLGPGVTDLQVGDEVVGIGSGGLSTFVNAPAVLVLRKPKNLDFTAAASLPLAFLTARYALETVGRMTAGERILIHAAAGGVGLAAVQLAQRAGLEVIATAGSEKKRDYLRSLGIKHAFDSRSLTFADEVRACTAGQGIDLVLNSLTGASIGLSLGLLRAGGRFLEIGKSQLWTSEQVAAVNPAASYYAIDLAEKIASSPADVRPLFAALVEQAEAGQITPLPSKAFPLSDAPAAFRMMARAEHIGKVMFVPVESAVEQVGGVNANSSRPRSDGTYLITGGLTGLGLATAEWLVGRGAGNIVLFGQRAPNQTALEACDRMRAAGANVVVTQADVTREADLRTIFETILPSLAPLRGVIHAAGLLEDGVLLQQDWRRFHAVLAPKVEGAWLLHKLTEHSPLDFFVMYSSASALLGAPGQGNHAAANAFLDALAHYRRSAGLPGLSINWGAWSEIGAAARKNVGQRISKQGIGEFTPTQGLATLGLAMQSGSPNLAVIRVDWARLAAHLSNSIESRFFVDLATVNRASRPHVVSAEVSDKVRQMNEAPPNKRRELLIDHIRSEVGSVIGLPPEQRVPDKQPLRDVGLDSLMAVELRNRLRMGLGIEQSLPATLVFDYPSVAALTDYLAMEVYGWTDATAEPEPEREEPSALDLVEQMSDEEVEQLLQKRMGRVS
jgi:myxalamid-type polyketide synthase MxaB